MYSSIEEAERRLPLRELAKGFGFDSPERNGQAGPCWFPDRHTNGDRNWSFNIYRDAGCKERFKCFACGAQGDGVDLIAERMGLDEPMAILEYKRRAGFITEVCPNPEIIRPEKDGSKEWPLLHEGTAQEIEALARLRGLSPGGLALAGGMGVLRFGTVCGRPCWVVTDESRRIAEARRMEGLPFPEFQRLPERKAHCLPGSKKSWPVGLLPKHSNPRLLRSLLLCEGSPDLLAAYHFAAQFDGAKWQPVAMLGRSCRIDREALELFAGRHVRIVPHLDADGGGVRSAMGWATDLRRAGAEVDFYKLPEGLRRRDGRPAKDLCDFANLPERYADRINDIFHL